MYPFIRLSSSGFTIIPRATAISNVEVFGNFCMWIGICSRLIYSNDWKETFAFNSRFREQDGNQGVADTVPTPIVIIDQDSDPDATVVEITFGDRLGALLDTVSIWFLSINWCYICL
jgi:hypothetical protein